MNEIMRKGCFSFIFLLLVIIYIAYIMFHDTPQYAVHGGCEIVDDMDGSIYVQKPNNSLDMIHLPENTDDSWLSQIRDKIVDYTYQKHKKRHPHTLIPRQHRINCESQVK